MIPIPDPLHPAVVHLPIALATLMPLLAAAWILAIAKQFLPARAWLAVVLLQLLLAATAWLAVETGEDQEERVERVVAEQHIEAHEEAAHRMAIAAGVAVLLMAGGLLPDRRGRIGRIVGALASFAVLAAAVSAGHPGGELVYRYGAASAYAEPRAETAARTP